MRLIDADELVKQAYTIVEDGEIQDEVVALSDVEEAPTVDPVQHGQWERVSSIYDNCMRCTACAKVIWSCDEFSELTHMRNYCPVCGAKMDEVNDEKA